jgi:hypothetical protein
MLTRRHFSSLAIAAFPTRLPAKRAPHILLRSSWQSVNIGDIGHTPGALNILWKYIPQAQITLWPGQLGHGSRELLLGAFPQLRIAEGSVNAQDQPTTPELARAWQEADLYLSGSGSGFPASHHAAAFHRATDKPVGVFGVSTDPISGFGTGRIAEGGTLNELRAQALALPPNHLSAELRYIIDRASFFFCRDTISRDYLKAQQVKCPLVEFGPDAQLGMRLRDDAKGRAWLAAHGLAAGKFICVIPRLRYTPYYRVDGRPRTATDDARDAINGRTTEKDHAKLREAIVRYVRSTGNKAMACAEMTYQVEMAKRVLVDPLPDDVKPKVVWRDTYWLPDEAASIYAQAQAVLSVECHSPLIALHNGTPAIYVRQPTDTCKGQMYRDFGAGDWLVEVDEITGSDLWSRLEAIHRQPAKAKQRVASIMRDVESRQRRMAEAVAQAVGA